MHPLNGSHFETKDDGQTKIAILSLGILLTPLNADKLAENGGHLELLDAG